MLKALILLFSVAFFLLAGCRKQPAALRAQYPLPEDAEISSYPAGKFGGRMIDASPGEPTTFNPMVSEDATSSGMIGLLGNGLTTYDPVREKVIPCLAKSWDISSDNKTFTFHLRRGLRWSDGILFTAEDVIFTFQCFYDSRFATRAAYDFSVDGKPFDVKKIDEYTVQIRTPDIFAPFLQVIGWAQILPKHKLEAAYRDGSLMKAWNISVAQKNPKNIVGMGMFTIHSYRPGERIVFEPNPHYFRTDAKKQRLPYVDFLITRFVKDFNASIVAFATGLTDSEGISPDNVAWVKRSAGTYGFAVYDRGPSTNSSFIWFNQNPGKDKDGKPFVVPHKLKWFTNQRFRQAISYGIDREGIVQGVLFGRGAPLWGPESPANRKWFNPEVKKYPFNPEQAMQLLAEADFKKDEKGILRDAEGNPVEFTLITNQENLIRQNMATVFMENMKALGIQVKLQFMDFGAFVGKIQDSFDYEAGLLGFTGGGDPVGGQSIYSSKGRLHQWHPSQKQPATPWEARIDELMTLQLKTLDEIKRRAYYAEVQSIMSEQVPFIYLVTPNTYAGLKNRWTNLDIPLTGSVLWNLDSIWASQP
ncbi:MAG: ABC transporter substrate-binding protein [Verrucomicrobiota bacterium]